MKAPLYQPMFKFFLFFVLTFFSFFQNGNAATEKWITKSHFEKKVTTKNVLKLEKRVKKKIKKRRKKRHEKRSGYDDFDYNILLLITFGIILIAIVFALFGSLFSLLLLVLSALLLMVCISNGAHKSAWWALGVVALIFWPIYFINREYD